MNEKIINIIKVIIALNTICFACNTSEDIKNRIPLIHSNLETIKYFIDGEINPNWHIASELKHTRLNIRCESGKANVSFITDVDSIEFMITPGDTVHFYVLLHNKDSVLTEIVGISKNVNFSDRYIQLHKGKIRVEIPEVHELVNIMGDCKMNCVKE